MVRRSLALSLLLACSSDPPSAGGTGDAASEGGSDGSGGEEPSGGGWDNGEPPDGPTTGDSLDCDPWAQDCATGEKCTHYNSMGESTHVDATQCVPAPPMPVQTGGICKATGGFGPGDDDCGRGEFCYFLGGDDIGVCVPLCAGSPAAPDCPDGSFCSRGLGDALWLCLPECDGLAQDCLEGANCTPQSDGFVCALDTSGEGGQIYDPCGAANGCDPGMMCAPATAAPDCDSNGEGCCLPLCTINGEPCPEKGLQCLALFDPETHPELSAAGVCAVPE